MKESNTLIQVDHDVLTADVRLGGAQFDYSEYLAHEIEHVLEQVDGIDLRSAVAQNRRGAHRVNGGLVEIFETDRAVAVGRLVRKEVRSWR